MPKDLDALFRKAMVAGSTSDLKKALEDTRGAAPTPTPPPAAVPESIPELVDVLVQKANEAPPERRTSPRELYEQLLTGVQAAEALDAELEASREALLGARAKLDELLGALEAFTPLPPVRLPPFRQSHALFLQTPGDAERARDLAEALRLDFPTARMVAMSRHPRVALRSQDVADLEERARDYQRQLGLAACVLDHQALLDQPRALSGLLLRPDGPWEVSRQPAWELDPDQALSLPAEALEAPSLRLVVVGEVQVRRFRKAAVKRKRDDPDLTPSGERRLMVIDLHHEGGVVRVAEGRTDLGPWPDLDRRSATLAARGFVEWMAEHAGCPVLTKKVCQPQRQPVELPDGSYEAAGWPAFEEHSRACRILFGL